MESDKSCKAILFEHILWVLNGKASDTVSESTYEICKLISMKTANISTVISNVPAFLHINGLGQYLHRQQAKAQASLCICAASPCNWQFATTKHESI